MLLNLRAKNCMIGIISSRLLGIPSPDLRYLFTSTFSNSRLSLSSEVDVTAERSEPPHTRTGVLFFDTRPAGASLGKGPPMVMMPPSSPAVASGAESCRATFWGRKVRSSRGWNDRKTRGKLTRSTQRNHASLPETKQHYLSRLIAAFLDHDVLDQQLQQRRALLHAGVGIEPARRRVEDDVVAPVRALEVEQGFGASHGDARRLGQVHLPAERGEGVVPVAQAVQEDEDVGWRVIVGRCRAGVLVLRLEV